MLLVENWDLVGLRFNPSWFRRKGFILWVGSICLWQCPTFSFQNSELDKVLLHLEVM